MNKPVVIVGGGLAAANAVEALRGGGYEGDVVLLGDEPHRPYERPPLSKGYLTGGSSLEDATVHEPGWYYEHGIELCLGTTVTGLDVAAQTVTTGDGELQYSQLLLATGCRARPLPMADASGVSVAYLRTVADSDRIRQALTRGGMRLVIIGGGWLGLEIAASARDLGAAVSVVESASQPLAGVLGDEVGAAFARLHRDHGVDLRTQATVTDIRRGGGDIKVCLDDGTVLEADLLVVAVGAVPNTELAEHAGLDVDNGVVVDAQLRTSHPNVFAAGDVAAVEHPRLHRRVRVEHWDNAKVQGEIAGANMAGADTVHDSLPFFFTDQYHWGMEHVGHADPQRCEPVIVRGDLTGPFTAFWVSEGRVAAGMHVNDWDATDTIRDLVGRRVDPQILADPSIPLTELAHDAARARPVGQS